jgi:hypothetical protein
VTDKEWRLRLPLSNVHTRFEVVICQALTPFITYEIPDCEKVNGTNIAEFSSHDSEKINSLSRSLGNELCGSSLFMIRPVYLEIIWEAGCDFIYYPVVSERR